MERNNLHITLRAALGTLQSHHQRQHSPHLPDTISARNSTERINPQEVVQRGEHPH